MEGNKKLTVIWIAKPGSAKNETTRNALASQSLPMEDIQLILCPKGEAVLTEAWVQEIRERYHTAVAEESGSRAVLLNRAAEMVEGAWVTVIESGDQFGSGYLSAVLNALEAGLHGEDYRMAIPRKKCLSEDYIDIFSRRAEKDDVIAVNFENRFACLPYFAAGTWMDSAYFRTHQFREDLVYEYEKDYYLRAVMELGKMLYIKSELYEYDEVRETNIVFFAGCYEKPWYRQAIKEFWIPFVRGIYEQKGSLPTIIQYQVISALNLRVEANLNNRNKHCISEENAERYIWSWHKMLRYVDDDVIMNAHNQHYCPRDIYIRRLFMKLKYNDADYELTRYYYKGKPYYGGGFTIVFAQNSQKANIQYMEYQDETGMLHVDGTLAPIYDVKKGHFYVLMDNHKYEITINERYSHTKLFGISVYKRTSFEVDLPIQEVERQKFEFRYEFEGQDNNIPISFDSHTSRLSNAFKHSYWTFGGHFLANYKGGGIVIYQVRTVSKIKRELLLWVDMLKKHTKKSLILLVMRMAYWFMKPIWNRRPVWMFIDKIYKAGDSSEYIYRYACAQKDGIDKYYLVDKNCADCKRLKADGFKPLIRGSIKHRLIFLYADMMVISNSTVFAFNDFSLGSSSYLRDLFNFHVCCVQHGMSVQKIAIAQNRLRDNIKLYFCASRYELDNLNRPVYDYAGRDILKLTGVPRYDGLINEDKRQILLTPTWRMQAAMPVTQNEGVARPYNPLFKESSYYKVYNSLINNPRLLEAAKQYNYRILYVLHPIVSPQVDDFDKNDYVDIVSAIGDMSYERVFRESSLMVSDFSGVQFDFAYMRKPLVYLHHDDIPQHYEEGTFHYDTMAFGEICHNNEELIDVLIEYMQNECQMKPEYRRRADDFFEFDDHNNCQRIYDVMIEHQRKYFK